MFFIRVPRPPYSTPKVPIFPFTTFFRSLVYMLVRYALKRSRGNLSRKQTAWKPSGFPFFRRNVANALDEPGFISEAPLRYEHPILYRRGGRDPRARRLPATSRNRHHHRSRSDRKRTRLNSSH